MRGRRNGGMGAAGYDHGHSRERTIVEQALDWMKGPPAAAPQCCLCGRTFLNPSMEPVRPLDPSFAYLRKDQHDDGVVMAMLYCSSASSFMSSCW